MSASEGVQFDSVRKHYRRGDEEVRVLEGLSFSVAPGEFVALMGPSGSGKSTVLNLIAGLDKPTGGRVKVGQAEPGGMSDSALCAWRSRHLGIIFQRYHLLEVLTASANVEVPLLLFKLSSGERKRRVKTALELVGLAERASHFPRQLSGGQEQRVAIARAIVTDPSQIHADEPTGDLDSKAAGEILDLLGLLNQKLGKTIVMVTHDPNAAKRARRVLRLEKGNLKQEGVAAPAMAPSRTA
jgi:putative ABC transport system ATP-binding protein